MAEKLLRTELSEEEGKLIAGGNLLIENNSQYGKLLWSDKNPDDMYTFGDNSTGKSLLEYLMMQRALKKPDNEQIQILLDAGLIWPK